MTDVTDGLFERHADFCKMFSNLKRLRILNLLRDSEFSVGKISDVTGIAQPTVSQHLRKIRDQDVVTRREAGLNNYYSITDERIVEGMAIMREVLVDRMGETAIEDHG